MKTEKLSSSPRPSRRKLLTAVAVLALLAATVRPAPAEAAPMIPTVRAITAPAAALPPLLLVDDDDDDDDDENDDDDDDGDDGDQDDDDRGGGMAPGGGSGGGETGGGMNPGGGMGPGGSNDEGDDDEDEDEDEDEDDDNDAPASPPGGGNAGGMNPGGTGGAGNAGNAGNNDDDDDDDDAPEAPAPSAPPASASSSSGGGSETAAPSSSEPAREAPSAAAPPAAATAAATTTTSAAAAGGNDDRFTPAAAETATAGANAATQDNADIFGDAVLDVDEALDPLGQVTRRGEILALTASAQLPALAQGLGLTVLAQQTVPGLNETLARLRVPNALATEDAIDTLRDQDPGGSYEYNHVYDLEQGRAATRADRGSRPRAAAAAPAGSIGMIDTAVDRAHPSLARSAVTTRDFLAASETAARGHGTAVASLLVGADGDRFSGLLPDRTLIAASVFRQSESGKITASAESLALAIGWMIEQQTPVINMSLAGPPNEVLERVITRALERGHVIVAAVGNAGPAAPPQYPAAYSGVIGVTAVDRDGRIYRRAGRGDHVDLAALGVDVLVAEGAAYAPQTGTSFAAPFVSAALAASLPSPDAAQAASALDALRRQALDVGPPGRDPVFGDGVYRLPEALAGGAP
jgi:hypothetical protein